jgi:hypothetical protein
MERVNALGKDLYRCAECGKEEPTDMPRCPRCGASAQTPQAARPDIKAIIEQQERADKKAQVRCVTVTQHAAGTQTVVRFSDQSAIAVDVSGPFLPAQKTAERITAAANIYSDAHPNGVLSGVVVNLFGEKIN